MNPQWNPGSGPHEFRVGDEEMPWRTYGQLWNEVKLTRGALDALVQHGKVPWAAGKDLISFFISQGTSVEGYEPTQVYYLLEQLMLADATARLTGSEVMPTRAALASREGDILMHSDIVPCPRCSANIQRVHLNTAGCRVCAPFAPDYGKI